MAPQLMNMWISWVFLALLLFWAVGAYNRLIRLRSAALQAFGALDAHCQRWIALLAQYAASRIEATEDDASAGGAADTQAALGAAAGEYAASLAVGRGRAPGEKAGPCRG